jgi:hypothetical protein
MTPDELKKIVHAMTLAAKAAEGLATDPSIQTGLVFGMEAITIRENNGPWMVDRWKDHPEERQMVEEAVAKMLDVVMGLPLRGHSTFVMLAAFEMYLADLIRDMRKVEGKSAAEKDVKQRQN